MIMLPCLHPAPQLAAFPAFLDWLSKLDISLIKNRKLDMENLAVAGHSRGGKLAALMYAYAAAHKPGFDNRIKTAYLLDPVDLLEPSAADALGNLPKSDLVKLGITGVGITTGFNPRSVNFWVSAMQQFAQCHIERHAAVCTFHIERHAAVCTFHIEHHAAECTMSRRLFHEVPGGNSNCQANL
jgi:pimeloyl-ACP methyl ester carboxylesterase